MRYVRALHHVSGFECVCSTYRPPQSLRSLQRVYSVTCRKRSLLICGGQTNLYTCIGLYLQRCRSSSYEISAFCWTCVRCLTHSVLHTFCTHHSGLMNFLTYQRHTVVMGGGHFSPKYVLQVTFQGGMICRMIINHKKRSKMSRKLCYGTYKQCFHRHRCKLI